MPQSSRDPILAIAHLVVALQQVASRNVGPFDQVVVTVGSMHGGTTNNVIPMAAHVHGTIRTMKSETREMAGRRVREIAEGVAMSCGVTARVTLNEGYPVTVNDAGAVARFLRVATDVLGADKVSDDGQPTMGGEDFAFYGAECPTCFYQLGLIPDGQESYPSVHTPVFDFNDDALEIGVRMMKALALSVEG